MLRLDLIRMISLAQEATESVNVRSILGCAGAELERLDEIEMSAKLLCESVLAGNPISKESCEELLEFIEEGSDDLGW